jgi:hypothetical protein
MSWAKFWLIFLSLKLIWSPGRIGHRVIANWLVIVSNTTTITLRYSRRWRGRMTF